MLGQPASSQTVCSPSRRTSDFSSVYSGPVFSRVLIHSGLRSIGTWLLRTSRRKSLRPAGSILEPVDGGGAAVSLMSCTVPRTRVRPGVERRLVPGRSGPSLASPKVRGDRGGVPSQAGSLLRQGPFSGRVLRVERLLAPVRQRSAGRAGGAVGGVGGVGARIDATRTLGDPGRAGGRLGERRVGRPCGAALRNVPPVLVVGAADRLVDLGAQVAVGRGRVQGCGLGRGGRLAGPVAGGAVARGVGHGVLSVAGHGAVTGRRRGPRVAGAPQAPEDGERDAADGQDGEQPGPTTRAGLSAGLPLGLLRSLLRRLLPLLGGLLLGLRAYLGAGGGQVGTHGVQLGQRRLDAGSDDLPGGGHLRRRVGQGGCLGRGELRDDVLL